MPSSSTALLRCARDATLQILAVLPLSAVAAQPRLHRPGLQDNCVLLVQTGAGHALCEIFGQRAGASVETVLASQPVCAARASRLERGAAAVPPGEDVLSSSPLPHVLARIRVLVRMLPPLWRKTCSKSSLVRASANHIWRLAVRLFHRVHHVVFVAHIASAKASRNLRRGRPTGGQGGAPCRHPK